MDYLQNSIVTPEAKMELIGYLNEAYYRILSTLNEIPDITNGNLLEIGANPYFLTLLIKKFRTYNIHLTNYFGDSCNVSAQTIKNESYNEEHSLKFDNINIEKESLPYPAESFDVVVFGEVLEHLTENPVFALYNIHRVLKKDGILIISTPNVYRFENIKKYLFNRQLSIYDPYSGYGIYGRHNREYSLFEIEDLLTHVGFEIIHKNTIYAKDNKGIKKLNAYLTERTGTGNYLLVKARKKEDFIWYFPEYLYRGIPKNYIIDDYIKMGKNCSIHIGEGWNNLEKWENGNYIRWTKKQSTLYLKVSNKKKELHIDFYSSMENLNFHVLLYHNNVKLYEHGYIVKSGWQNLSIEIPEIEKGDLKVDIIVDKPWSPKALGINNDIRELGIAVKEIGLI
jgi:SAM-dependent methyltransferase